MSIEFFVIFCIFALPVLCAFFLAVFVLWLLLRRSKGSKSAGSGGAETEQRLVQEINAGLSKMEKRIEALETILIEETRKPRKG